MAIYSTLQWLVIVKCNLSSILYSIILCVLQVVMTLIMIYYWYSVDVDIMLTVVSDWSLVMFVFVRIPYGCDGDHLQVLFARYHWVTTALLISCAVVLLGDSYIAGATGRYLGTFLVQCSVVWVHLPFHTFAPRWCICSQVMLEAV